MTLLLCEVFEKRQATTKGIGSRLYGYDDNLATAVPVDYVSELNPYRYSAQIPSYVSLTGLTDKNLSYFANAAYTCQKRYIISAITRKDESNLFGVNANQKAD